MLNDFYEEDLDYDQQPQNFNGVLIYPIVFKDRTVFYKTVDILLFKKNRIKDPRVIGMSYLEFLDKLFNEEYESNGSTNYCRTFLTLMKLVFKEQEVKIEFENEMIMLKINEIKVYASQFDDIRECILKQNNIEFDDFMSEEFENELQEAQRLYKMKHGEGSSLNERKVAYHCATGVSYNELNEISLFLFNKGIDRLNVIKEYEVMTYPLIKSGEKNINHWCSHIKESKWYDKLVTDLKDIEAAVE